MKSTTSIYGQIPDRQKPAKSFSVGKTMRLTTEDDPIERFGSFQDRSNSIEPFAEKQITDLPSAKGSIRFISLGSVFS